jgi:hypothetical protein
MDKKLITLYNKAKVDYQDLTLNAPYIQLNQAKNLVIAHAGKDSIGDISEYAEMKQGDNQFKSEGMEYDFKSKKGLTKGTITQQGEMFVHSDIVKKVDEHTMYSRGTFFTTCNLDHPHFGFRAKKAKIVNKKVAVTGSIRPEFDSVPVPIYLPFGYFPLYQGRHSGFMAPQFETNDLEGLGLSNMGYYKVVNEHWDVKLTGDIYSLGTWSVNVSPTYNKIYKYRGSMDFGLRNTRRAFKGDPDYSNVKTYSLRWSHASDMRSRPGTSFTAGVNMSSTRYNKNIPNSPQMNFQNVLGSSITYAKTWQDKPFNLTASANHNQNNQSGMVSINLPDLGFTVSTLYPFQKKEAAGSKKWYEQLGIGYQGSFRNAVSFNDTIKYKQVLGHSVFQHMLDTLEWSARHSIPITLSLPPILGGALMVAPSVSYSQEWVDRKVTRRWDSDLDTLVVVPTKGFYIKQQASFGLGFNTALYGTFRLKNASLRHVVRPTFGFSYSPDLNKKFMRYIQINKEGYKAWFNELEGLYAGSRGMDQFVSREFGGINFGLDNSLEMKKRSKGKDSTSNDQGGFKKIRLVEGFGFSGSYNLFADSMKLSPFSLFFRTNLLEKINITVSGTLVPYLYDSLGNPTKHYAWSAGRITPGRLTNANISLSTSFQSKPKDPAKEKKRQEAINQNLNDPMLQQDQHRLLEYMRQNPAEFVDFNTQWSLSLSSYLSYVNMFDRNTLRNKGQVSSAVNLNGSFNLTPKWNLSASTAYDFNTMKMQTLSVAIARDLHCWQMALNVSPIGLYRFFNFTISPKAGILQDLKINRTRSFSSQ